MSDKRATDFPDHSSSRTSDRILLHRAPWVTRGSIFLSDVSRTYRQAPANSLILDGGVLVSGERIIAVDRYENLIKNYPSPSVIDHEECILTPALVNAHAHLELSYLSELGEEQENVLTLPGWIRKLLAKKTNSSCSDEEILAAGRQALDQLFKSGTGLVADMGNRPQSRLIGKGSKVKVLFFLELLGMTAEAAEEALAKLNRLPQPSAMCTVHAPYSSSPNLIREAKKQALDKGNIFSIHVAESQEELQFLRHGTGDFQELLSERGGWDRSFSPIGLDNKGAINYLDDLGILDAKTLCVHVVQVTSSEIALMAERQAKVCLCPGSNRNLGVGKAPAGEFVAKGILPALGTDSLASNPTLSIWQEMKIMREDHPGLKPEVVFSMATEGGARALGYTNELGTLTPGKRASFLAIEAQLKKAEDVFEFLTSVGKSVSLFWIG